MRRLLTLILILAPAILLAQSKVHLEFQSDGARVGWIADQLGPPPSTAAKWDGKSYDLDASGSGADSIVQVLNASTGNVATKKLSSIKNGWLVKDADFNLIAEVKVRVEHEGQPVEVAGLDTNDGARAQSLVIDSSSKGVGSFYDVKPGNFTVIVNFHSDKENKTQKQSFAVDLKRDSAVPLLVVSITKPVATVAETPIGAPLQPSTSSAIGPPIYTGAKPTSAGQQFGTWASYIIGLFIAILVIYFGFTWLQKNQDKAQGALGRFGVSLSDPNPIDPAVHRPLQPIPIQPVQQILLGDPAPTPLTSIPTPSAAAVHVDSPQLKKENGEVISLADGTSVVGRDDGLAVSLVGEGSVSRKHAELIRNGTQLTVRDLGSTNGTYLNGVKIDGEAVARPGDTIQFGTVRMRYEA